LIPILHEVQDLFGYVPPAAIGPIAHRLQVSQAEVHGVVSFYSHFRLSPAGRHHITVCAGTACHVEGMPVLLRELRQLLGIDPGERTTDGLFSLSRVGCLGCCAMAPAMMIDGRIYPSVSPARLSTILAEYGFTPCVQTDETA
jgi:NADH:ubiquinone oxidoreductase subunit E